MNNNAARLFAALSFFASGCYVADVDAVDAHLRDECGLDFVAPACDGDDAAHDKAARIAVEKLARHIDTPEKERCVLDVDCDGRDADAVSADIVDCVFEGTAVPVEPTELADCFAHCDDNLGLCGEGSLACGERDVVEACFDDHERCIAGCSDSWGNTN